MKLETILSAMIIAIQDYYKVKYDVPFMEKRLRQSRTFRNRILRMFEERQEYIEQLIDENIQNIKGMSAAITSKEKRIAELEEKLEETLVRYEKELSDAG